MKKVIKLPKEAFQAGVVFGIDLIRDILKKSIDNYEESGLGELLDTTYDCAKKDLDSMIFGEDEERILN